MLAILLSLIEGEFAAHTQTTTATTSFTMYAFNGNGMTGTVKLQQFSDAVHSRQPHAFVISETKTNSKLCNSLPHLEYEIFEEAVEPSNNFHTFKWGMILGIHKDAQILQRVTMTQLFLKGRIIAADVTLLTHNGIVFTHRVIRAYAPWNPGGPNNEGLYWPVLTEFCLNTTTSWSLAGCNCGLLWPPLNERVADRKLGRFFWTSSNQQTAVICGPIEKIAIV